MADTATTAAKAANAANSPSQSRTLPWTEWTGAALLLRVCAALLLLLSGTDKFKSATSPAVYSLDNYYGSDADLANPDYSPKFIKIVKVVYSNSGLDNSAQVGEKFANTIAWSFYRFGQLLPWLMIGSGFLILIGALSRLAYLVGGFVWISLIAGQLMLPDAEAVSWLLMIFLTHAAALALTKHNRVRLTHH